MQGLRVTKNPSRNKKLVGDSRVPFYATYRAVGYTCPSSCALLNNGCYAQAGKTSLNQKGRYSEDDGTIFLRELDRIPHGAFVRLHVAGDVMIGGESGSTTVDEPYLQALIQGAKDRPDLTIYGYTHAWKEIDHGRYDWPANLTLNASCDSLEDAHKAREEGWQTVTVVPSDVTWKRQGDTVICPNQTTGMSCYDCRLCMRDRPMTVAFKAHGTSKRRVDERIALPTAA